MEQEERICKLIEQLSKGVMAQISAVLNLVIGIMASQGVPVEQANQLYKEALIVAQREYGITPIKEKQDESNR